MLIPKSEGRRDCLRCVLGHPRGERCDCNCHAAPQETMEERFDRNFMREDGNVNYHGIDVREDGKSVIDIKDFIRLELSRQAEEIARVVVESLNKK